MRNSDYYLPAIALGIAFVAKLPALRRGWRDPLVRSVHFLLFSAAACFFFAAPPTITAVNRITGIPNVSAPLVYGIMCAFSCACLVLVVNWQGGPAERVRRGSRRWIAVYGVAIVAVPVLFALGDAPDERLRDLDTYYANTPYIREMIITYLAAHITSACVTTLLCLRWARAVRQWLRAGLTVLVIGFILNLGFGVAKLTAVVARWAGADWDHLSSAVAPPLAAVGGLITTVGFLLPLLGPQFSDIWRAWITYTRLGVLWRRLRPVRGEATPLPVIPWWASPELRLTVRETVIHDELLRLQPYLDDRVRRRAYESAITGSAPREHARTVGVAAMVAAAVEARRTGRIPEDDEQAAVHAQAGAEALTAALSPGLERLVRLSGAFASPHLTDAVREEATRTRTADPGRTAPGPDTATPAAAGAGPAGGRSSASAPGSTTAPRPRTANAERPRTRTSSAEPPRPRTASTERPLAPEPPTESGTR
ncbi:MAB_1171c family putative transporter [Streptomyces sp. NPDC051018]|uniref:MAB_1171c family putative transporter n=1 Tax=Streptomyces sp. NPDC051018 TaxID=3365639 RepID=UPI0037B11491